jgi:carbohydrate-selective porin OprB
LEAFREIGVPTFFTCGLLNAACRLCRGPIPGRHEDSCGFGAAYATTNGDPNAASILFQLPDHDHLRSNQLGRDEILLSWYYQMKIRDGIFVQPNLTEVVDPGRHGNIPDSLVFTLRVLALF